MVRVVWLIVSEAALAEDGDWRRCLLVDGADHAPIQPGGAVLAVDLEGQRQHLVIVLPVDRHLFPAVGTCCLSGLFLVGHESRRCNNAFGGDPILFAESPKAGERERVVPC